MSNTSKKSRIQLVRTLSISVIATLSLVMAGCSGSGGSATGSKHELDTTGTFKFDGTTDPGNVNPRQTTLGMARQVYKFGYDQLIATTPKGKTVPNLASKWRESSKKVVFTLKEGIKCHNGHTLSATDAAAAVKALKKPQDPWDVQRIPVDYTVTADDDARTVTVQTKKPFSNLLRGAGSVRVVCPDGLDDPSSAKHAFKGTGPYKVDTYDSGSKYLLRRVDNYKWGPDGATSKKLPKKVQIRFVKNESTSANELTSAGINAAQITGPDRKRLDKQNDINKVDVPVISGELDLNEAKKRTLHDKRVRKAIAMATNRSKAAQLATDGRGSVATNVIVEEPVQCPGNETKGTLPQYDLEKAKSLLDDAGWRNGKGGIREKDGKELKLTAIYKSDSPQPGTTMEYLAQVWKKLGVKTDLVSVTNTAFSKRMYDTLDYDISFSGLNVERPLQFTQFHGGPTPRHGGRNSGSTKNERFDTLSEKALHAPSTKKACKLWRSAHKALLKDVDVIPLAKGNRPFYVKNGSLDRVGLHAVPTSLRLYK